MSTYQQEASFEDWVKEMTGSATVHPGHPLVIASAIIRSFDSFAASVASNAQGHSEALSDARIPGTGDHVCDAIETLKMGFEGASADDMISFAREQWARGQAGGHVSKVAPGQEQADLIAPWFKARAVKWLSNGKT